MSCETLSPPRDDERRTGSPRPALLLGSALVLLTLLAALAGSVAAPFLRGSSPDVVRGVAVTPVPGWPGAYRIVAHLARTDGGPLGAWSVSADLVDPVTRTPLLGSQCGFDVAPGHYSLDVVLSPRFARPLSTPRPALATFTVGALSPRQQLAVLASRLGLSRRSTIPTPTPARTLAAALTLPATP